MRNQRPIHRSPWFDRQASAVGRAAVPADCMAAPAGDINTLRIAAPPVPGMNGSGYVLLAQRGRHATRDVDGWDRNQEPDAAVWKATR